MTRILRERYRIVAPIGEGGMGAVYLADDLRLEGRQCAVKKVSPPRGLEPDEADAARAALAAEASVLARLDHPGLPHVTDHFEADGSLYLVMDYVPGQDLKAVLTQARSRRRQLEEEQVRTWAEALCGVLTYLHRQEPSVIHRDIKPANVKLMPDGQVRLVDFGLARPLTDLEGQTLTVVTGGGSRAYQPLEQYGEPGEVDPRSDIYALGATMYHLLSGHAPPAAQARFLAPGSLTPLRKLRPDLSPKLAAAVTAAMALHPDDRPRTAEELRRMIVSPAEEPGGDWSRAIRRNLWLLALVLTLLLAAMALTVRAP